MSLKKFEILEMIAKGGMAEVYRAKTTGFSGFQKEVCVKKILPHLTEDESFVTMFINEAKLAATLNYANIVQVHDLCVSAGGEYFIVMEYVNGKDLSDVIRAAQLAGREIPPEIAVYICREISKGLYYAHNQTDPGGANLNIIHRDISPHNVLVSFMGEVKITDFGIAKASSIANKTAVGILKGKYGYMSPEQARGQPLDHRSDIFNTGIVLYELLVGERCFAGSSDFSTLNLMRNAEVTPPTKIVTAVPAEVEAMVLKALSKERKDRFQDALEFESALGAWAKDHGAATATELARFVRELFAQAEERENGSSTGVLALSSVVGPPPSAAQPSAQHQVAAPATPAASPKPPSVNDDPGKEALERAKRRATKARSRAAEPAEAPRVAEARPVEVSVTPAAAPQAPEVSRTKTPPAEPAAASEPAKATPVEKPAPAPEPAKAAEAAPAEKPTRKPARLKGAAEAPPPKAAAKAKDKAASNKRPVGRKNLRPGLTQLQKMPGSGWRTWAVGAAVVTVALIAGVVVGTYRGAQVSRQTTFRTMEVANREGGGLSTVTAFIISDPPGATVRFDSRELSEKTPVAVERDHDQETHQIILSLEGYKKSVLSLKYTKSPITIFNAKLEGDPGRLEVSSQPSELPVFLDGKRLGETPLYTEVPGGKHVLEIGGGDRAKLREEIEVTVGKKTKISRKVPSAEAMAQVRIDSEPKARILVNGQPTGHITGDGPLPLAPGVDHRVSLEYGGAQPRTKVLRIHLNKGENRAVYVDLTAS